MISIRLVLSIALGIFVGYLLILMSQNISVGVPQSKVIKGFASSSQDNTQKLHS
jgi:hypothetical protein